MARSRRGGGRSGSTQTKRAWISLLLVFLIAGALAAAYLVVRQGQRALDEETLCPGEVAGYTVLLVDVTDPMNAPQRRDFLNQLERLRDSIPLHGRLTVFKVDATSAELLQPVIERCNPGNAEEVSELTGNPAGVRKMWEEEFRDPLDRAFETLVSASGADRSPILESVQSVALTELQKSAAEGKPRRLIVVSDLLQNMDGLSFYSALPDAQSVVASEAFRAVRADLTGVEVELWMLQRDDHQAVQPDALTELWEELIAAQGGRVSRVYKVIG